MPWSRCENTDTVSDAIEIMAVTVHPLCQYVSKKWVGQKIG